MVKALAPKQPPDAEALAALKKAGLHRCTDLQVYNALRWSRRDRKGGILFASHLPLPWGVYFRRGTGPVEFLFTVHLETGLFVLSELLG